MCRCRLAICAIMHWVRLNMIERGEGGVREGEGGREKGKGEGGKEREGGSKGRRGSKGRERKFTCITVV